MPEAALGLVLSHNNFQRQENRAVSLMSFYKEQLNFPRVPPPPHLLPTHEEDPGITAIGSLFVGMGRKGAKPYVFIKK